MSRQCPELSIVVVGFDMQRELPRTLLSLGSTYQRGMKAANYEVIVVDNGSTIPLSGRDIEHLSADIHLIDMPRPCSVSPSRAVNAGIAAARGNLIGVWIDGARLASAGLLGTALIASRLHERAIIGTLGFHLGPDTQMNSVKAGYDQTTEDALLDSIDWPKDPDRLFEISTFAGSSRRGWFGPIAESNALFMRRSLWEELGGYDESFKSPGGGLVNLDTWKRACALPDSMIVMLLGEGTFHQVHGGVATNAVQQPWSAFHEEYARLRGAPFRPPMTDAWQFGRPSKSALSTMGK